MSRRKNQASHAGNQITRGMHPGAARHFHASLMATRQRSTNRLKGRSAPARPDPVPEKCDQASEESAPWWRAKLGQVAVRQESGHKRHRSRQRGGRRDKRHCRSNTAERDELEEKPSHLTAKHLDHADRPEASQETGEHGALLVMLQLCEWITGISQAMRVVLALL